ncbi:MAG: twin-arginine translocase subunit TatC [Anaerolineales bacterium]
MKRILTAPLRLLVWLLLFPFRLAGRFLNWLISPIKERIRQGRIYRFLTDVPEERPIADAFSDAIDNPQEILDQLDEVRAHLGRALLALAVTVVASFYFATDMIDYLARPIGGMEQLQAIEVTEPIAVFMRVALFSGIALATPYIAFEVWWFFAPGLMPKARLIGLLGIPAVLVFFIGGAAFAYFVMMPAALPFLLGFLEIETNTRASNYITFVTGLVFWIGVAFQFPLIILLLSWMGLVNHKNLLKHWRIAIVAIAVLSAAITPTIDPVNMALVMLPMTALYFLSIFFSWIVNVRRMKDLASDE